MGFVQNSIPGTGRSSLCVLRRLLPAHGGTDPGAVYKGRQEKDDNLELTLEVGKILEENGGRCGLYKDHGRLSDAF